VCLRDVDKESLYVSFSKLRLAIDYVMLSLVLLLGLESRKLFERFICLLRIFVDVMFSCEIVRSC
jgi:hypothetical protein